MRSPRHVLIDAFNVIFGCSFFDKALKQSREDACRMLIDCACTLHDVEGHQVTVVFDGTGERPNIEYPVSGDSFAVIYSPASISADGIVERMLVRTSNPERMLVVSDDHMIRDAALAHGAEIMGIEAFMDWIKGSSRNSSHQLQRHHKASDHHFSNRLPL